MKTSSHADMRARKRVGVSDITRHFQEALEKGHRRKDLRGQLRKYLDKESIIHKSNCVVYHNTVYWFNTNEVLITVIPLHQKWHKYLK